MIPRPNPSEVTARCPAARDPRPRSASPPRLRPQSKIQNPKSKIQAGFTLLEILLSLALVAMMLVALNTFVFSMGELWGKNTDIRLFEQHVRAVTRALERELRTATLPPSARANASPVAPQEIRPSGGASDTLLTFELPAGTRLISWPGPALPEVVCSLQAREKDGLILLWHSRLEPRFDSDPPREAILTPFVTALAYDYYDTAINRWTTETALKKDNAGQLTPPQRLRLKFAYGKFTRETVVPIASTPQGLPNF
ncbi:MAG: prepilin-type N-terminal cleavage/methylation domain-containing protein [Undibacterium sp.]|nr:prepilin-type N-terminal cleavage/methylation domain-containing protein [Opitutaceae bacterium]